MIDINLIRTNPELVKENIKKKFQDQKLPLVDEALELDGKRRALIAEGDALRSARNTLSKKVGEFMRAGQKEEAEKIRNSTVGYSDRVNPDYAKAPDVAGNEENVLGLLLIYAEHRRKVIADAVISKEDFFTDLGKRVFEYAIGLEKDGASEDINLLFTPEEVGRITKMKLSRMKLSDNGDEAFYESVNMLKNSIEKRRVGKFNSVSELDNFLNQMRNKEKDGN